MEQGYRFFHPIEVRYRDIDAQRHVNNATYITYMEQARVRYLQKVGLWSGEDFDSIGVILAEQCCTYLRPISFVQEVEVGVRTTRLGNKSLEMGYVIRERGGGEEFARGRSVLVAYDYQQQSSMPIPEAWRRILTDFEGAPLEGKVGSDED